MDERKDNHNSSVSWDIKKEELQKKTVADEKTKAEGTEIMTEKKRIGERRKYKIDRGGKSLMVTYCLRSS